MASEKLLNALNDQFNFELLSGYYYMAMASYCSAENMNGFSHFFHAQSKEEYEHAMKLYEYVNDIDGRVRMQAMTEPKNDYSSFLEVFEEALSHEELVTKKIHKLLDLAVEEKDYPTMQFLQWFVEEQVEEEASMKEIISKLERIDGNFNGLYQLDKQLAGR